MKKVSIIGGGKIGQALGTLLGPAGYEVVFGLRDPGVKRETFALQGPNYCLATVEEAVEASDMVIIAFPHEAWPVFVREHGGALAGRTVIDTTNPFGLDPQGRIVSTLGAGLTQGTYSQGLLPEALVFRAFSHVMDELLISRGTGQRGLWAVACAGQEGEARERVGDLVVDCGYVPVWVGGLEDSGVLDPGGSLFPHLYTAGDLKGLVGELGPRT